MKRPPEFSVTNAAFLCSDLIKVWVEDNLDLYKV